MRSVIPQSVNLHSVNMKFLIVSLALVAAASAQYPGEHVHTGAGQHFAILRQAQDISPDGSYAFNYETENGIAASEAGAPKAVGPKGEAAIVANGQFQYTAPDGTPIALTYVADENGFQPNGAHIPTPPPIPEVIQRALAYIAAHPGKPEGPTYQPQQSTYRPF